MRFGACSVPSVPIALVAFMPTMPAPPFLASHFFAPPMITAPCARRWFARAISFAIAWVLVLLALGVCSELFGIRELAPLMTLWACVGILVRVALSPRQVAEALPHEMDVGRALRFLVISGLWPILVWRTKR